MNEKDYKNLDDLFKDMRNFINKDYEIFHVLKTMHEKREEDIKARL